ncbi:MAG: hypothetical protein HY584_03080 [Candidatus Omnitrophica bacterium]|nr:hypothetical protein [Candidatus Omnitrophota bacterium]
MKLQVEIKLYDDAGQLLSSQTKELLGLSNQIGMGGDSGYGISESQAVEQTIQKAVLEAQAQNGFFKM